MKKIWVDHDGGVDDFMAMVIATKIADSELVGVTVIDGDCFVEAAVECSAKVLARMGYKEGNVVVAGVSLPAVNPFPKEWRGHAHNCNDMPCITGRTNVENSKKLITKVPGEKVLADYLRTTTSKLTIVVTGPLSTIAYIVNNHPELTEKIEEIVVMGGAIDVKGNVSQDGHDGTAEWNLYWDPQSAADVFKSDIPVVLFPLDATNSVPIDHAFVSRFGDQNDSFLSQFAGSAWALCTAQEHTHGDTYFAWDALTAAYLVDPSICEIEERHVAIDLGSQGRTLPVAKEHPDAKLCKVAKNVRSEDFYSLVLRLCA